MKKLMFMALLLLGLGSCQKDPIAPSGVDSESQPITMIPAQDSVASTPQLKAAGKVEYAVSPRFGKPNTTTYVFKVYDPSGTLALSVKLYDKATGNVTYLSMPRIGSYWKLSTTLSNNGWFEYRYVYSANKSNISNTTYQPLCNSRNTFSSSGISSISWPFGADGSSWNNRLGWIGPMEPGGCGSGWNQGGHHYYSCGADDSYAEDWNKNCSSPYADDGATVRSPLDGKVIKVFIDSPSNHNGGYGNAIDIQQEASSGQVYTFRIAHLKYAPTLSVGAYVKASTTTIGKIGMTGGTSTAPHGHCVLYNATSGCNDKSKFSFCAN